MAPGLGRRHHQQHWWQKLLLLCIVVAAPDVAGPIAAPPSLMLILLYLISLPPGASLTVAPASVLVPLCLRSIAGLCFLFVYPCVYLFLCLSAGAAACFWCSILSLACPCSSMFCLSREVLHAEAIVLQDHGPQFASMWMLLQA